MSVEGLPMNKAAGRVADDDAGDRQLAGIDGLSAAEVASRIEAGQYNKPPQSATKTVRRIFRDNLVSVFNAIIGLIVLFLLSFYVASNDKRLLLDAVGVLTIT